MINIEKFLEKYRQDTNINYYDDCVIFSMPFFHFGHDESIAIKVTENDEWIVFSDCHTTEDYLELEDVELSEYSQRLESIIKRFGLVHDGNVFRMSVSAPVDNCSFEPVPRLFYSGVVSHCQYQFIRCA